MSSSLLGCVELVAPQRGRTALVSALECDAKGERIAAAGVQKIVRVFDIHKLVEEHREMDDEGNQEMQERDARHGRETGTTSTSTSTTTTLTMQFSNPAKVSALTWGSNDTVLGCGTFLIEIASNSPTHRVVISRHRRVTHVRKHACICITRW